MSKVLCDIFWYILGISYSILRAYLIPDSDIKMATFSHKKILLNFISCDISLLIMDTEIFAAYAGSCLFKDIYHFTYSK